MSHQRQDYEQSQQGHGQSGSQVPGTVRVKGRGDELRAIYSPLADADFERVEEPSPQLWQKFSRDLQAGLSKRHGSFTQTVRDRLSSSERHYRRWMWALVAVLALLAGLFICTRMDEGSFIPTTSDAKTIIVDSAFT